MYAKQPTKEEVREVMRQHREEGTPPLSPEEFRTKLGWGMLPNNDSRVVSR